MAETKSSGGTAANSNTKASDDKSFIASAQARIGDAVEATVDAIKEHPVTAAAIATGAAAAVGGAVYAATQLRGDDASTTKSGGAKSDSAKK